MNNQIRVLNNNSFNDLNQLKYINLDHNLIEEIQSFGFNSLFRIKFISLRYNELKLIENYAFYRIRAIDNFQVDLHNNQDLNEISKFSFDNIKWILIPYEALKSCNDYLMFRFSQLDLSNNVIYPLTNNSIKGLLEGAWVKCEP